MFDREIVMDSLQKISKTIETILERAAVVTDPDDLLCSPGGMMRMRDRHRTKYFGYSH